MTDRRRTQTGQAALEGVGLTVVIALLLAAVAAWTATTLHGPGRPPDVIGRVAEPLAGPYDRTLWERPTLPSLLGLSAGRRATGPIGRALRTVGSGIVTGAAVALQARAQFMLGFAERVQERAEGFIRDPIGEGVALPDPEMFTPRGIGLLLARNAGALWDYARFLRTLPPRTAILRASRDAGHVSGDLAVEAAQAALRKRLMRGRAGTGGSTPPTGPDPARRP